VPRVYLLLHINRDLRNSTVADWLLMFATCGRFPWKAPTIVNSSFENMENMQKLKYLETTVTNQNVFHEEIKSRLSSNRSCYQ
jgi:hypothetical protein